MDGSSSWIAVVTIGNYALLGAIWTTILFLYVRNYFLAKVQDSLVAALALVLAFDALKTIVESVYFGILWAGRYHFAFEEVSAALEQPLPMLVPKLLNLSVALVILCVIIRKWMPAELRERRMLAERQADLRAELVASLSETRTMEERWNLTLAANQEGTWDYDVASGEIWTSPRLEAMLGYSPGELSRKLDIDEWLALVHVDDVAEVRELLEGLVRATRSAVSRELRIRVRDGTYRRMLVRAVSKREAGSPASRVVCSVADVTDQREAEAALAARQRVESLGVLAGGVAHDFNNLLAVIRCNASIAKEDATTPDARTALADLDAAVARAAELTSRLLAYSGKGRFVAGPVDVSALGREMTRLLASTVPEGIRLETDFDPALPNIEGDSAQMQQVFLNLYTNAVDALRGAKGTVTVRTRLDRVETAIEPVLPGELACAPGDYVVLEVEDTGIGMSEATRARIFEPFFSSKGPSRGLGLSAMLGILRAHGAGMRIRTAEGQGTRFTLWFPVHDAEGAPSDAETDPAAPRAERSP